MGNNNRSRPPISDQPQTGKIVPPPPPPPPPSQKSETPLRAKTYQVVARGKCPNCNRHPVDLRFVFNPYGDDDLLCEDCGEQRDSFYNEHSKNQP